MILHRNDSVTQNHEVLVTQLKRMCICWGRGGGFGFLNRV